MPGAAHQPTVAQRAYFALLYLCEGAPIGYIWWALPTRLKDAGMEVDRSAAIIALLTLPWALKFLWAPAIDRFRGRRWGYRAWITVAQIVMGLTLVPLAIMPIEAVVGLVGAFLMVHAFAAATQDVAIDAFAIATIPHESRGRITGWMQAGMLTGRAVFGGLALAAEDWIGARGVVSILIACIWFTLVAVWLFPMPTALATDAAHDRRPLMGILRSALSRTSTWAGLGVALLAGAGFEAVGVLVGPYLRDHGAASKAIGFFLAFPVVASAIVGGLVGGWAADRIGHRRLVVVSIGGVALSVYMFVVADAVFGARGMALMVILLPVYFCLGSLTAASYALFMDITDPAIGGTQFSAFMGATNLCEVWSVAVGGVIVARLDYGYAFLALAAVSLLAIPLVPYARSAIARTAADSPPLQA